MLKFLEGREKENTARVSIRNKPNLSFGISLDSPTHFQTKHSVFSPRSYVNPFSDLEGERLKHVPKDKKGNVAPEWTHKIDISQQEEEKVVSSIQHPQRKDRYHQTYNQELKNNSSRFRLTKGEFTEHLQRNKLNADCFGPLHGEERSAEKYLETKRSIMRESTLQLERSREKLAMTRSMRKESSRLMESFMNQKRSIRNKRDLFYHTIRHDTGRKNNSSFELPKVVTARDEIKPHKKHLDFGIFKTIDNSILTEYLPAQ